MSFGSSAVASLVLAAGVAAVLSAQAQAPSLNGTVDRKTIQSIRVKVIGCIASGSEAGHYRLTHAFLSGDGSPATAGKVGTSGSGQDISFENSSSFDLISDDLKPHIGHKVEVIGITSDTKLNKSDSFRSAIGSTMQDKATLTVSSLKMIAATCP